MPEEMGAMAPGEEPEPQPGVVDPELADRIRQRVDALAEEDAAVRQAAEADLAAIGPPALARLLFAVADSRLDIQHRLAAGDVLGRLGDPRFDAPDFTGPWIEVPAGPALIGSAPGEPEAQTNALPQHEVDVALFAIGRFPLTNRAYALFVEDGGYEDAALWHDDGWAWKNSFNITAPNSWQRAAARPNHPVTGICWYEARACCAWLTGRLTEREELRGGEVVRLPTEAEWEKAARGGLTLDRRRSIRNPMPARRFPWGDAFLVQVCNTAESGIGGTSPVGMFPDSQSPYKLDDLGGNVMEWCSSRPVAYPFHAHDGRESTGGGVRAYRVARGGAWPFSEASTRCAYRHWQHADFRGGTIGLRLVRGRPAHVT
jgi:formylglycine-generating enzyme required for sulfatase activity